MQSFKEYILTEQTVKTWFEIRNEQDPKGINHDLTMECIQCNNTVTCRCMKPKRLFKGLCNDCAGIDGHGNKI